MTVISDNDGASAAIHFFGVELGAAPGQSSEVNLNLPSRSIGAALDPALLTIAPLSLARRSHR